ncbi:hypothetical protein HY374_01145 [Candidatus Berkelbacteria bacterium]|nr:hypothetical protein [Candidatus Berkelbacteria bacterium]
MERSFSSTEAHVAATESPNPERSRFRLNEADWQLVRVALEGLVTDYFDPKANEELPGAVLFPDTSARLLAWATKPIVDAVYGQRSVLPPHYAFLQIERHSGAWPFRLLMESQESRDVDQERLEKVLEQTWQTRFWIEYRLREILEHRSSLSQPCRRLLLADDMLHHGETYNAVAYVLRTIGSEAQLDAFALFGQDQSFPWQGEVTIGNPERVGMFDFDRMNSMTMAYAPGVTKPYRDQLSLRPYVQPMSRRDRTPGLMGDARWEFAAVGREVASEILGRTP